MVARLCTAVIAGLARESWGKRGGPVATECDPLGGYASDSFRRGDAECYVSLEGVGGSG